MNILATTLLNRLGLFLLAYLSLVLLPGAPKSGNIFPGNLFLDGWTRWDSQWYAHIAIHGYTNAPIGVDRDTALFPLYPLLMRGLAYATGDVYTAGMIIANVSLVIACLLLHRLIAEKFSPAVAWRTVTLILVFPFSLFFSAVYAESTLLMFIAATFLAIHRTKWRLAACIIAFAGATRIVGVLLVIPLLIEYLRTPNTARKTWKIIELTAISSIGLIAWMTFLAIRFHNPLQFIWAHQTSSWTRISSGNNFAVLWRDTISSTFGNIASGAFPLMFVIQLTTIALAVATCLIAWRRLPLSYAAWTTAMLLVSIPPRWLAAGRLIIVIFPLHLATALIVRDSKWFAALVYFSTLLLALMTIIYTQGLWVA